MTKQELNNMQKLNVEDIYSMASIAQSIVDLYVKDDGDKIMASPRIRLIYELGKNIRNRTKSMIKESGNLASC